MNRPHAAWLSMALLAATFSSVAAAPAAVRLPVPVVRQARERCGPAALAMVLRYYRADPAALGEAEQAYDPALRGTLISDLAAAARRAGFPAAVRTLDEDSLVVLLERGVPPILLFERGLGPVTIGHYGVVIGWDPERAEFALNDGGAATRTVRRERLLRQWRAAGSLAVVVARPGG